MGAEPGATPGLVLLPSVVLGPAVWAPVADRLRGRGWRVRVPPSAGQVSDPAEVLVHLLAEVPVDTPVVLVPHSNAGLYVAALAAARDVRGTVFVDAGLPADRALTPTAPPSFRAHLATLVDEDGRLPVWTQWWPGEDLSALFPDDVTRAAVEAEQVGLPLAYFEAQVPSPAGWADLPCAYLAFGEAYAEERARAETRGWPTLTIAGEHLHPVVDPEGVSEALVGLLGRLGFEST